eukprot:m.699876 g.699876  ORF g.699876 m.699876 type:complete len:66 (-) comp58695_c0_seq1:35-232(-)
MKGGLCWRARSVTARALWLVLVLLFLPVSSVTSAILFVARVAVAPVTSHAAAVPDGTQDLQEAQE